MKWFTNTYEKMGGGLYREANFLSALEMDPGWVEFFA
jgi:hypothetical protein